MEITANGNPKGTITDNQVRRIYAMIREIVEPENDAERWNAWCTKEYGNRISGLSTAQAKSFIEHLESVIYPMEEEQKKKYADDSIGALWKRQTKVGEVISGKIKLDGKEYDIVAFTNKYKKDPKHPDFKVFKSKPMQPRTYTPPPAPKRDYTATGHGLPGVPERPIEDEVKIEDIPF